jgi:WD40 repeat protein
VTSAVWNGDGNRIMTTSLDGTARIWDANNVRPVVLLTLEHDDEVSGATWSRDESRIMTFRTDGTVSVWEAESGEEVLREPLLALNHDGPVPVAVWNRDESRILTSSTDGLARIWDANTGQELFALSGDGSPLKVAQWNTAEDQILLVTARGLVVIYKIPANLLDFACRYVSRNLTLTEWRQYLPHEPYRKTCPNLPRHPSVPEG